MELKINAPGVSAGKSRRFWTILDKMIAGDLLKTLAAVLSVIVLILISQKFISILTRAIEGKISNDTVLSLLGLKTIIVGINFLPASIFIAILIVLGRMYRDHEMDALASAGVGLSNLYRSVIKFILPLSLCAFVLSLISAPWAEARIEQLKYHDKQTVELRGLIAGRFQEYSRGDLVYYIEDIDKNNRMYNIFVQNKQQDHLGIINAKYGSLQDLPWGRYIVLEDGERIQGNPGSVDFVIEKFDKYGILIKTKETGIHYDVEAVSTAKLLASDNLRNLSELHRRLTIPLGILVLGLLAVPMARLAPRGGVYGNIALAFLIYFSYANIQKFTEGWILQGAFPVWVGFSWVYLLMFLMLLLLMVKFYGREWIKLTFKQWVAR